MTALFDPIRLGDIEAPNRIFMAPMTRARGTRDHVPTSIMAQYYAQPASAGLIISEAIGMSQRGLGWPFATGLWSDEQVAGWLRVTDAVHAAGGRIIAQLWHMGRTVHPSCSNGGVQPLSASGTTAPGHAHTYNGKQPYVTGRPMRADEVPALLDDFRRATRNALRAGFDGVQVHAANGYLIDEFLRDGGAAPRRLEGARAAMSLSNNDHSARVDEASVSHTGRRPRPAAHGRLVLP
jgi:2,4-dienoyl-CoA reductase-like NADH-dependent reductase (Old Yellow Enzyme family)